MDGWSILVPNVGSTDAVRATVYFAAVVWLSGACVCRLLHIRPRRRLERAALALLVGTVWSTSTYLLLLVAGVAWLHVPVALTPVLPGLCRSLAHPRQAWDRLSRRVARWRRSWHPSAWAAVALVFALASWHVARVASLVEVRPEGMRLYGAFYSDKFTSMSLCAALRHGAPPAFLRYAGHELPSHYFPHATVAALDRNLGIDYIDGYWFYAPVLGVVITSLAVLAFGRRMLRSRWLPLVALAMVGLYLFGPEGKPLDLSVALLLVGVVAIDLFRSARHGKWLVVAGCLFGCMTLFEVHLAAATCAGLGAWWLSGVAIRVLPRGWRQPSSIALPSRTLAVGTAACVALLTLRLIYSGEEASAPPTLVTEGAYRQSFKHEWRDAAGDYPALSTLYAWKRGKTTDSESASAQHPTTWQLAAGDVVYELAFVGYLVARFIGAGAFGALVLLLPSWRRRVAARDALALCMVLTATAYAIPLLFNWGHYGNEQWWWTPNVYRVLNGAFLLLVILGAAPLVQALRQLWRPAHLAPLTLCAVSLAYGVWHDFGLAPETTYHFVQSQRLEGLAFLRQATEPGEVVVHPWTDDVIYDDRHSGESWVYKDHCTLGSNLAGCQVYYEGREEHVFVSGFIRPEEAFDRSRLRASFYQPDRAASAAARLLAEADVRWVVATPHHPAPQRIAEHWPVAFHGEGVQIYRSPELLNSRVARR